MKTAYRKAAQAKRQQRDAPPDTPSLRGFGITFDIYQGRARNWRKHMTTKDEALQMALVLACVAAVALTVLAIVMWGLV